MVLRREREFRFGPGLILDGCKFVEHCPLGDVPVAVQEQLPNDLAARVNDLQEALSQVKQLQGILPICSHCKKVRDDKNYWQQVESYISAHSEAQFSHSICPDCFENVVKPEIESWERKLNSKEPGGSRV